MKHEKPHELNERQRRGRRKKPRPYELWVFRTPLLWDLFKEKQPPKQWFREGRYPTKAAAEQARDSHGGWHGWMRDRGIKQDFQIVGPNDPQPKEQHDEQ